jgi:hypothetical protein
MFYLLLFCSDIVTDNADSSRKEEICSMEGGTAKNAKQAGKLGR